MKIKALSIPICLFLVVTLAIFHYLYYNNDTKRKDLNNDASHDVLYNEKIIEIWGKSGIGNFLWEHIFEGDLKPQDKSWSFGEQRYGSLTFRYRTGHGVVPSSVPADTQYLVMVLGKVDYAQMWLNYLPSMPSLRHVALVLLGNEKCNNLWLTPYLKSHGGYLDAVFLVYDSPYIDNITFFQWPLGVATYRNFPKIAASATPITASRPFLCNFLGTVYKKSSRETLMQIITDNGLQQECFAKPRYEWMPHESDLSREEYIKVLKNSDLTLNPVGKNTECYRIYEAMSLGSIPVIEDHVVTPSDCGKNSRHDQAPLRLLKQNGAPVIYVKHWSELPEVLKRERLMSQGEKVERRRNMVRWYETFKHSMRDNFISVIRDRFELNRI